ncbi:poly a polymerase [Culex quinquefasciatus]|uniref:Poly a polymerase n=1 Tax=Culex quinquefasciatus TaxID=7176 RepID=B0WX23_CULQU|nr:poly a polymerase [Culex quinquefasciatus]|eukprot:XP_001861945.1 poly a polymerase [Culex quinquefasciatus]
MRSHQGPRDDTRRHKDRGAARPAEAAQPVPRPEPALAGAQMRKRPAQKKLAVENLIKTEQLVLENSSGNQEILPAAGRQYCSAEDATKQSNDWHQSI